MPRPVTTPTAEAMKRAIDTHLSRVAMYGERGYAQLGEIMSAFFPDGITLKSPDDFARYHLFEMIVAKLNRYANNYEEGGHADSIHDVAVYAFVLEGEDDTRRNC
jgi:hypothetical protein